MNSFLIYILKSTLCISLLYLLFRTLLRKESFFALNRIVLLSIVVSSVVIPLLYLPGAIQSPVQVDLLPVFAPVEVQTVAIPATNPEKSTSIDQLVDKNQLPDKSDQKMVISRQQLWQYLYLAGFLITLLMLLRGLFALFSLFRTAKSVPMDGYRLLVIEKEIAAFSFGRYVILSQKDYNEHRQTMLAHEQAHVRLHHFFDLLLLEAVRIFHWFNPVIYLLIKDMKEIHEFQADDYTLTNGIDATQYQLLIIQKGVGPQRFALANSFNYCQIKKRIEMMNKQKPDKAWSWKVAVFLPLLALLLMAFGRQSENVVDHTETRNPVNQKNAEKKSLQSGISREQLLDYQNIVNKAIDNKGGLELSKLSDTDKKRLETLFLSMNAEQKEAQIVRFIPEPEPFPKKVPTIEQLKILEDSTTFGVWINDKRVKNSELRNYTNTDFALLSYSKLEKNAINYGKHFYQVNLMTNEYYANYLAQSKLKEKYFICIRRKKEEIKSKSSNDIDGKTNLKAVDSVHPKLYVVDGLITDQRRANYFLEVGVESVTILNGKDATDKYGEKAKNGVVEITLVKENIKESNNEVKENIEVVHADKFVPNSENPSIMYFYNAHVKFNEWNLTADYIEVNKDSSLIYATGRPDSTGAIIGKPVLVMDNQKFTASKIRFNYKAKKGIIENIVDSKEF